MEYPFNWRLQLRLVQGPLDELDSAIGVFSRVSEHDLFLGVDNTALTRNRDSCENIITGGHQGSNLALFKLFNDRPGLRFEFVFEDE